MKIYEYTLNLSEGVNPYNTHAITTTLLGKDGALFSAYGEGSILTIRTPTAGIIPNGKLKIVHGNGLTCIANLDDYNEVIIPDNTLSIKIEMSYLRKTGEKDFCPVWSKGFDLISIEKILANNGMKLNNLKYALPGTAITMKKVHIYNIFTLSLDVTIVNNKLFEKAYVGGIGQRKSYGFGMIRVQV